MHRTQGTVATAFAVAVSLTTAAGAGAHAQYPLRPPTAHERAQFEKHRSHAARQASTQADPALGSFAAPFTEPTLTDGRATDQDCVTDDDG